MPPPYKYVNKRFNLRNRVNAEQRTVEDARPYNKTSQSFLKPKGDSKGENVCRILLCKIQIGFPLGVLLL